MNISMRKPKHIVTDASRTHPGNVGGCLAQISMEKSRLTDQHGLVIQDQLIGQTLTCITRCMTEIKYICKRVVFASGWKSEFK